MFTLVQLMESVTIMLTLVDEGSLDGRTLSFLVCIHELEQKPMGTLSPRKKMCFVYRYARLNI